MVGTNGLPRMRQKLSRAWKLRNVPEIFWRSWLFNDQSCGAEVSATVYSIIETARANSVEPMHYINFLLRCMERFSPADMPWDYLMPTPRIRDYAASIGIRWGMT